MPPFNYLLLPFLLFSSGAMFGQPDAEVLVADFNEDGRVDSLRTFSESGSAFGHKEGGTFKRFSLATLAKALRDF
ncbi:MAG: hypothetical protein AB8H12_22475 [Lewinella sp.]